MNNLAYGYWLALVLTLGPASAYQARAQRFSQADSSALAGALAAARQPHAQATQAESRLLTGTEYVNYSRPNATGHQFFQTAIAQPGSILYDGYAFADVALLYDIRRDQVVLPATASRQASIQLLAEKVRTFTLGGHHFVRVVSADTTASAAMPTGFYDLLLAGPAAGASLLARRTKREVQESVAGHLEFGYEEKTQLFLQKGNVFTEVATLKSLLNLLPDHKTELQKFARSNHLRFKGDHHEEAATALLAYYNTLVR